MVAKTAKRTFTQTQPLSDWIAVGETGEADDDVDPPPVPVVGAGPPAPGTGLPFAIESLSPRIFVDFC